MVPVSHGEGRACVMPDATAGQEICSDCVGLASTGPLQQPWMLGFIHSCLVQTHLSCIPLAIRA